MPASVEIEFPAKLRFLFEPSRYKVAWGGRGSAKSWSFARALLVLGTIKPLRILCARQVQRSLRESVHQLLKDQIRELDLEDHYRILDTEIRGKRHDTLVMYAGLQGHTAESIKSYEGVDVVWVEEGQMVPKRSWDILIPTIRKPGSEIWISMNPELKTDDTYQRFIESPPPDSKVVQVNYIDNPWFGEEMESERAHAEATTDPEDYKNIWLGEPRGSISGSIFGKQMSIMRQLGRIGRVNVKRELAVNTFWDLGSSTGNATAIWLHQRYGAADHFVKYVSDTGHGMRHFWDILEAYREKHGFRWGVHHLPHDGRANLQGAELINRVEILESLGKERYGELDVVAVPRVTDLGAAIEITRRRMTDAYLDEDECAEGIKALDRYRYEWIEAAQAWSRQPYHDQWSNGCLVAGSMVETPNGRVPIEDIVPGMMVQTPAGTSRVEAAGKTREVDRLLRVTLTDGAILTMTGEHKVFTTKGVVRADALRDNDGVITSRSAPCMGSESVRLIGYRAAYIESFEVSGTGSGRRGRCTHRKLVGGCDCCTAKRSEVLVGGSRSTEIGKTLTPRIGVRFDATQAAPKTTFAHFKSSMDCAGTETRRMATTAAAARQSCSCIEPCGRQAMGRYLTGSMSTIATMIVQTTALKILRRSVQAITLSIMVRQTSGLAAKETWPICVPSVTKLRSGMEARKALSGIERMASHAWLHARSTARRVKNAAHRMKPFGRAGRVFAPRVARLEWLTVERTAVYDMTVAHHHCYVANGVLVSNCDAFRQWAVGYQPEGAPATAGYESARGGFVKGGY